MGYRRAATDWIRRNIRKIAQLFIFVLAAAMILLEVTNVVELTWQAISLFALLTVVAVLNDLERIDFGDFGGVRFEDEIDTAQRTVARLEAAAGPSAGPDSESDAETGRTDANASGSAKRERESTPDDRDRDPAPMEMDAAVARVDNAGESDAERSDRIRDLAARLADMLETNPRCALLQLRLELEHAATANAATTAAPAGTLGTDAGSRQLAAPIDEDVLAAYAEVRSLCNSAVHSRTAPDPDEAARIVDLGLRVLERLDDPAGPS